MMLLLWTVHHLKDPHYSNVECISGGILKMLYAYFHQFEWKPYLILRCTSSKKKKKRENEKKPNPWGFSGLSCICSSQCSLKCQNTTLWCNLNPFLCLWSNQSLHFWTHPMLRSSQLSVWWKSKLAGPCPRLWKTVKFHSSLAMFSKRPTCSSINVESPPVKTPPWYPCDWHPHCLGHLSMVGKWTLHA